MKLKLNSKSNTESPKPTAVVKNTQKDSYEKRNVKVGEKDAMGKHAGDRDHRKLVKESRL